MIRPKDRITTSQTAVIVTSFLLATGILTLPRTSVAEVKTPDVWTFIRGTHCAHGGNHHRGVKPPVS